jgi:uncharacterized membrane protein
MKQPFSKLKSAFVSGILIVLPAWLAVLLLLGVLAKMGVIVKPITKYVPPEYSHPWLIGALIFLLICFLVGVLLHTALGRSIGSSLEEAVLSKIPGYASLRAIARQATELEESKGFKPALIQFDDGLNPGFLIEEHGDTATVFIPSVPTPMAGSVFIMENTRVFPLDVPVTTMMRCVSKWGAGSGKLMAAMGPSLGSKPPGE